MEKESKASWTIRLIIAGMVSILVGCGSSQPRFTHDSGALEMMLDNKTARECWAGPVQKDDGSKALADVAEDKESIAIHSPLPVADIQERVTDRCRELQALPHDIYTPFKEILLCAGAEKSQSDLVNIDSILSDVVAKLREHPEKQKVIQVHGLPYCKDL
jgi:hypothetical protein